MLNNWTAIFGRKVWPVSKMTWPFRERLIADHKKKDEPPTAGSGSYKCGPVEYSADDDDVRLPGPDSAAAAASDGNSTQGAFQQQQQRTAKSIILSIKCYGQGLFSHPACFLPIRSGRLEGNSAAIQKMAKKFSFFRGKKRERLGNQSRCD